MCSTYFDEGSFMDDYQGQGDLADILRPATNRVRSDGRQRAASTIIEDPTLDWGFPPQHDDPVMRGEVEDYDFGDPFSNMKDPLLHELELVIPGGSSFFGRSISEDSAVNDVDDKGGNYIGNREAYPMSELYVPPPMPSSSHQQDPPTLVTAMPSEPLESPLAPMEVINPNSRGQTLIDTATAMQISARNSSMKRRKGQAKKVVCIPAPASANGRAGSEVVPSDLWAWRKYGQKPIKGSPHPRGYYRCSSSKGCSARKQVERSRTDPNMLVITYTSEHNHPWPTQRNALAGSTRATQSSNKNNGGNNTPPKISSSPSPNKDQQRRDKRPNDAGGSLHAYVKEEVEGASNEISEEDGITGLDRGRCDGDNDDFLFRDLEGIDDGSDPLNFLLNQEGLGENSRPKSGTAGSDSFSNFFIWSD